MKEKDLELRQHCFAVKTLLHVSIMGQKYNGVLMRSM